MSRGSLLILNARIPIAGNDVVNGAIEVSDGEISAIRKSITETRRGEFDEVIDASGLIAVPGGIDIHAHIYDPDYTHHEDFLHGSIAAAFGSITTFYDMPLRMYVDDLSKLKVKVKAGLRDSIINFSVIAGMMNEVNITHVRELREAGVKLFKLFTCKPFRPESDSGLTEVIKAVNEVGGVVTIHAEDDALIDYLTKQLRAEGRDDPLAHHESRPPEAEAAAVYRVINIARYLKASIHLAHISSAAGAEAVRWGKASGISITAETCPHYLIFTKDDVGRWGNYLKMNPSLKTSEDVKALWRGLADGTIDAVTSDHAPSTREEKEGGVWSAWGGIPGLETMFPLIFTYGVKRLGILTLERYVKVTSENPARIAGIYPKKGVLAPGSDADIALIDPNLCFRVDAESLHYKVGWTPYEGLELCGWPRHVIVGGNVVIRDRELVCEDARGAFIRS